MKCPNCGIEMESELYTKMKKRQYRGSNGFVLSKRGFYVRFNESFKGCKRG